MRVGLKFESAMIFTPEKEFVELILNALLANNRILFFK